MRTRFRAVLLAATLAALTLAASCGGGGGEGRFEFVMGLVGLPDGTDLRGHFEIFLIVNGRAISAGKFVVIGTGPNADVMDVSRRRRFGTAARATFGPASTRLGEDFPRITEASHVFVTIEPDGDHDREPSCQIILAGEIIGEDAMLSPLGIPVDPDFPCASPDGQGGARLALADFSQATGAFQLRAPTDDDGSTLSNDFAGVWFVDDDPGGGAGLVAGLQVPALPGDLRYEGWARVDGELRSLGRFSSAVERDEDFAVALQRGDASAGPPFPGGDFVRPFVPVLAFDPPAIDLTEDTFFMDGDWEAVVTVEPVPDNDLAPFQLEVLSAVIPPDAVNEDGLGVQNNDLDPLPVELPACDVIIGPGAATLVDLTLAPLGGGATDRRGHYELFATVGGQPQSIGPFIIDGINVISLTTMQSLGDLSLSVFTAVNTGNPAFPDTGNATEVFITLEDEDDADPLPSRRVLLQGFVTGGMTTLTVAGDSQSTPPGRGLADFFDVEGSFQLDTASNNTPGAAADDQLGILYSLIGQPPFRARSLTIPTLPAGWSYEGWVRNRQTGALFSTGKFRDPDGADDDDAISLSRGPEDKPGFPGEDFVNPVATMAIPAAFNGSITEVMVTIEPTPDDSTGPSFLRLFQATVPPGAVMGGVGGVTVPMTRVFDTTLSATLSYDGQE